MARGKRRGILPALLGIGLLVGLSLWVMYEMLRLSTLQRRQQRQVGEMALALVREIVLPGETALDAVAWPAATDRLAAAATAAGILHARVEVGDKAAMRFGEDPFSRRPRGPSGCRDYGHRIQAWDTFLAPAADGKETPVRLVLALDVSKVASPPEGVDRLALIVLALGCGAVAIFLLAWAISTRNRRLQVQLAEVRAGREHHEELALAAAGLAHETKNPLGIIRGLAQQIAADPGNSDTVRRARDIMEEADVTTDRLGDFLRYARVRSPDLQPLAAVPHLERVAGLVADEFRDAGIELHLDLSPVFILADAEMLVQVIVNLLLNSLRHTQPGGRVTLILRPAGAGLAELTVRDTGSGIPEALQPNLFKPYVGERGGTGLGLAIVKRIVDQSGWKISLDSRPGRGTAFTIGRMETIDGAKA
jgi:signal transduction histidine kinase